MLFVFFEKNNRGKICISGGLAIGVPGELRAYQRAYLEFGGGVTWRELFQPTIELCQKGFVVSASQAAAITQSAGVIRANPTLRFLMA
jgi:gamma-glutamyltranspeptidase/glutathione hydrolase/leukotriene-C4 hydrolase